MMRHIEIKRAHLLAMLVVALGLVACGGKTKSPMGAGGRPLGMVAVVPDEFDSPALRDSIKVAFGHPVPILPQPEPMLDIMFTTHANFTSMFRNLRNIFYISVDDRMYTGPSITISRNDYAMGQILIHAKADTMDSLYKLLRLRGKDIGKMVYQEEIQRRQTELSQTYSTPFLNAVKEQISGVDINAPVELEFLNTAERFVWGSNMLQKNRIDFLVYSFPYRDKDTFTRDYLVHKRDSVLGQHIKGQYEGSHMTTEKRLMPTFTAMNYKEKYRVELRGLWEMKNDMMGGPFVMHAIVDGENKNVVVAEAFVYNPSGNKRNLMLHAESALYTLRLEGADFWTHKLPGEEESEE